MLTLKDLIGAQKEGDAQLRTLSENELMVLQGYVDLASDAVLKRGAHLRSPVDDVVLNAFRAGIALGVSLQIKNGAVAARRLAQ